MASKSKKKPLAVALSVPYSSSAESSESMAVLHEGWCTKESGSSFMGKTNWRRRWFKLVLKDRVVRLEYYKGRHDRNPAGAVTLDASYCTRQLESYEKPHLNCFAVGPLVDDGATRTYYISCSSMLSMREWMTVIDAAIQGVPEQALSRRLTITKHFSTHQRKAAKKRELDRSVSVGGDSYNEAIGLDSVSPVSIPLGGGLARVMDTVDCRLDREELSDDEVCADAEISDDDYEDDEDEAGASHGDKHSRKYDCPDSSLSPAARLRLYGKQLWRMEHWRELGLLNHTLKWSKSDVRDGVTVARCRFGRNRHGYAVIKVEGVLKASPDIVYNFIKISTKEGGKLDYFFRNETLLDVIEEEPQATVIFNQFLLPLPHVSQRDVVALKMWVPPYVTTNGSCGMVMFSVDHPRAPPLEKGSRKINIGTSGLHLSVHPGPDGMVFTKTVILVRLALYGALHRMMKGAYNSGLLKLGLRTSFQHMQEQLLKFVQLTR